MGVEAMITRQWPSTEVKLLADSASNYAANKTAAITEAIAEVYSINPSVSPLPLLADIDTGNILIQQHVADVAMTTLIPIAINYYMHTDLSVSESYQGAGSGTTTKYNAVDVLNTLLDTILEDIRSRQPKINDLIEVQIVARTIPVFFTTVKARRPFRRRVF